MTNNNASHGPTTTFLFVGLYSMIFSVGLVLNLLALCIFIWGTNIRSLTTTYMKNLAFSDLLLVFSLPMRIYYYSTIPKLPEWICEMMGVILLVNMYGSIFLLTCISWDRCMAVCYPINQRIRSLRKKAKCICFGVWVLTIGASIPAYFLGNVKNNNETGSCFDSRPLHVTQYGPVSLALTVGFVIPLAIMTTCSWALMRAIQKSVVAQMKLVNSTKIRNMIATNLTIFLLCFLPYHSVLLLYLMVKEPSKLDFTYRCTMLAACFNTILDPLAYYFATETFQKMVVMDNLRKVFISNSDNVDVQNRSKILSNAC
ncbi:lysophosphatidic acid receptor 6-like [Ambystoma mexicanum]|uniref:lysophosphatidic acid receptor 6-like n=1 Tax=Ambystoma mexicanum TaxID=8296 RepID=UPI0037E7E2AF